MSMNFFFKAFSAEQINAMLGDARLVDAGVDNAQFTDEMDVETAWDVLQTALQGAGFDCDKMHDNALFNGAMLVLPASVARQAQALQAWAPQQLLDAVAALDPEADLYHSEIWADEDSQDELLEHFQNLQQFYAKAAAQNQGVVIYAA